jgi:hypothetical protein
MVKLSTKKAKRSVKKTAYNFYKSIYFNDLPYNLWDEVISNVAYNVLYNVSDTAKDNVSYYLIKHTKEI